MREHGGDLHDGKGTSATSRTTRTKSRAKTTTMPSTTSIGRAPGANDASLNAYLCLSRSALRTSCRFVFLICPTSIISSTMALMMCGKSLSSISNKIVPTRRLGREENEEEDMEYRQEVERGGRGGREEVEEEIEDMALMCGSLW